MPWVSVRQEPCNKGATQHESGTTLNKPAQNNFERETSETSFIQKNTSVFWPGNFLEDYLSQYRIDCGSEDCPSHRQVKFYL